ncbi:MAG: GNAT family N-acetyltransferase [Gemmatimonadaceae bacterium]
MRSAAERRAFIELPFRLHRDDPRWVPPLRRDVAELLDPRRHPFHAHAQVELFLARSARGRVVGRVAAVRNELHERVHREPVGFFGFFETERDPAVAAALLDAAAGWLAARGLVVMRGPASLSLNEECGLLVEGFDTPPAVMMAHNPPWYAELLEGCGFRKAKDLLAYDIDARKPPPERLLRFEQVAAERYGVTVRTLDRKRFGEEVERIRVLYNQAWEANWGFVPMTEAEFAHVAKQMKPIADFDFVAFAEVRGELAGFALALPDVNQALRHMGGRLLPLGWLKGLWHGRHIDAVRVLTLGVLPRYRRAGAAELMYLHLLRTASAKGLRRAELSWVLEDNAAIRTALENLGGHVYKRYRLYDRPLAAPA